MKNIEPSISRKKLLATAGTAAAVLATNGVYAQHEHHHGGSKNSKIISTALDCVETGEICVSHCIDLMKNKDTSLVNCMEKVHETIAACKGLATLAAGNSPHLKEFAKVCMKICADCETECKKHASKHPSCKDCADACRKCINACKAA